MEIGKCENVKMNKALILIPCKPNFHIFTFPNFHIIRAFPQRWNLFFHHN
jgi:hypothetical protein